MPTRFQFTGQYREVSLGGADGLYYFVARWYDHYLNRWIQPDSIIPSDNSGYSPLTVDYHEKQFLEKLNRENRNRLSEPQTKLQSVPSNPLAFDRYSFSLNNPLTYTDPDGHCAFLIPLAAGVLIGGAISTATYIIATKATGQDPSWSGAAGAFAGGAIAGAVSIIATPVAGTLLHAAGMAASGTALVAGTAAVNAFGGAASYLVGGYTQNAFDTAMGNTPTFVPTVGGAVYSATVAAVLSPAVGKAAPVANNTIGTLKQASYFMPGRTISTLFATQNARNLYYQAGLATGISYFAGINYTVWK